MNSTPCFTAADSDRGNAIVACEADKITAADTAPAKRCFIRRDRLLGGILELEPSLIAEMRLREALPRPAVLRFADTRPARLAGLQQGALMPRPGWVERLRAWWRG